MSVVGQIERETQDRVIELFQHQLDYKYLGNWENRSGNSHVEVGLLRQWLSAQDRYSEDLIDQAIYELRRAAAVGGATSLYQANNQVYELLRYGIKVSLGAGLPHETVWLIDWSTPADNH